MGGVFSEVCSHLCLLPEHSITEKITLSPAPDIHLPTSCLDTPVLDGSRKWNRAPCGRVCRHLSLSVVCSVHPRRGACPHLPAFHGRVALPRVHGPCVSGHPGVPRPCAGSCGRPRLRRAPVPSGAAGPPCRVRARWPLCSGRGQLGLVSSPSTRTCAPYRAHSVSMSEVTV